MENLDKALSLQESLVACYLLIRLIGSLDYGVAECHWENLWCAASGWMEYWLYWVAISEHFILNALGDIVNLVTRLYVFY